MPNIQILPTAEAFHSEKPNLSVSAAPSQLQLCIKSLYAASGYNLYTFQGSQACGYYEPLYHRTPLFHRCFPFKTVP